LPKILGRLSYDLSVPIFECVILGYFDVKQLDAGVPEKVILLSRDERSMLIASYGDLKRCLEGVYQELVARASGDKSRPSIAANLLAVSQAHAAARLSQRQLA
jgi:hypothetical protein